MRHNIQAVVSVRSDARNDAENARSFSTEPASRSIFPTIGSKHEARSPPTAAIAAYGSVPRGHRLVRPGPIGMTIACPGLN